MAAFDGGHQVRDVGGRRSAAEPKGQALVEFILIFPLLFLLIVNVMNFGLFIYEWITVANAARAGAQYWITGRATVYSPSTPIESQVVSVITTDMSSLPNNGSLEVEACTNNDTSGTPSITCQGSSMGATPPADPEHASYASATVDVKYTYQPLIPLWSFPSLNIYATLPSTTIHRQAVMRVMN
jgi:Flp pilus assembly protein TadG